MEWTNEKSGMQAKAQSLRTQDIPVVKAPAAEDVRRWEFYTQQR
jgi:hypothetical protein